MHIDPKCCRDPLLVDRRGFDDERHNYFRSLLYLISFSVVGAATVGVFIGVGFLWLTDLHPDTRSADPILPEQVREAHEVRPPWNNDTAWGSSSGFPADAVAAIPTPDPPSNREVAALRSTAMEAKLIPPPEATHAKRVGVRHHRYEGAGRRLAASWRPDASAGPNPGGGFYGAPNVNIGRVNPN